MGGIKHPSHLFSVPSFPDWNVEAQDPPESIRASARQWYQTHSVRRRFRNIFSAVEKCGDSRASLDSGRLLNVEGNLLASTGSLKDTEKLVAAISNSIWLKISNTESSERLESVMIELSVCTLNFPPSAASFSARYVTPLLCFLYFANE